jgi:CHASE2 domain-containing sensor protein
MESLRADVARLALRVLGTRLRRDRYGRRVLLICIVLLGAACFFYFLAELVVPAFFPVLHLAFRPTITRAAAAAFLPR